MPGFPSGRATIIRFEQGAPGEVVRELVASALLAAKASRKPRAVWCALVGEFFMREGAPVVVVSAAVPKAVIAELIETSAVFNPTVRKAPLAQLAFRGTVIVYLSDQSQQVYSAASAKEGVGK